MLTIEVIAADIRRNLIEAPPSEIDSGAYPTLARFPSAAALTEYLDAASLYGSERNAVVRDLLRYARILNSPWARRASLYAFLPGVRQVLKRLRRSGPFFEPEEVMAEVLAAAMELLAKYDPDTRSPHVQAAIEHGVCCTVFRRRIHRSREYGAETELSELAHHDPDSESALVTPFPDSKPSEADWEIDEADVAHARALMSIFIEAGRLSDEEAQLLIDARGHGRTTVELSANLGVDRRTVARRVDRALARVGADLRTYLVEGVPTKSEHRNGMYRRAS